MGNFCNSDNAIMLTIRQHFILQKKRKINLFYAIILRKIFFYLVCEYYGYTHSFFILKDFKISTVDIFFVGGYLEKKTLFPKKFQEIEVMPLKITPPI